MVAPTSIFCTVDSEEYSRFERDAKVVTVFITPAGATMNTEDITVELVKARRNRDVVVATKTLTLTSDDPAEYQVPFDLSTIVDAEEIPKVRRGGYLIRATSVTDPSISNDSEDFIVSLVTVSHIRGNYLHGTDQTASEILAIADQPVLVTGVTVTDVSASTPQQWFPLTYAIADDGAGNVTRSLSWCNGPLKILTASTKTYTLRRGREADFIKVKVPSITSLPTGSISEDLLVDKKPMSEDKIRGFLDQAISWIEDSELSIFLEPTSITTEPDAGSITYPEGTDIPVFENADWDKVVNPITFRPPSGNSWISFVSPYRPLLRFDQLYGQVANTRIVDIALEWVEHNENGGFVQLVPYNQEVAFNFIGLRWMQSMRGPIPLPNFWNFDALVGYRKTPAVLLELIGKKAAIDILTIAGQAFKGGFASQSISRDGISESVSYTASATFGIYSATITEYKDWIDDNLVKLRGATRGPNMVVV
ncbi:MAG: hypothetical protein L3J47_00495 [Sulfurovum sp.]|nr:hypothetical protein [Sulfurovum sp.]